MNAFSKASLLFSLMAGILFFPAGGTNLLAQDIRTERVSFLQGSSSATLEGRVSGDETVDYLLRVSAGQHLDVRMSSSNRFNYFNIMEPGEQYEAIFVGSTSGSQFEGTTARSGDYRIRVYLMRNAARRGEQGDYRLELAVTGSGEPEETGDALVPGTSYHATGSLSCSMGAGQPTTDCPFGVIRRGGGSADVHITKADGRKRVIFFEKGKALGYDESQADPGEFKASQQGDAWIIQIGEERYEIFEAIIYGG